MYETDIHRVIPMNISQNDDISSPVKVNTFHSEYVLLPVAVPFPSAAKIEKRSVIIPFATITYQRETEHNRLPDVANTISISHFWKCYSSHPITRPQG